MPKKVSSKSWDEVNRGCVRDGDCEEGKVCNVETGRCKNMPKDGDVLQIGNTSYVGPDDLLELVKSKLKVGKRVSNKSRKSSSSDEEEKPVKKAKGRKSGSKAKSPSPAKKAKGRPRKSSSSDEEEKPVKKAKGRPRKSSSSDEEEKPVKKAKGRPRKSSSSDEEEPKPKAKKAKGRPPKQVVIEDEEERSPSPVRGKKTKGAKKRCSDKPITPSDDPKKKFCNTESGNWVGQASAKKYEHVLHYSGNKFIGDMATLEQLRASFGGGTISQNFETPKIVSPKAPRLKGCTDPDSVRPDDKKFCNEKTGNWTKTVPKTAHVLHINGKKIYGEHATLLELNKNFNNKGTITNSTNTPSKSSPRPRSQSPSPVPSPSPVRPSRGGNCHDGSVECSNGDVCIYDHANKSSRCGARASEQKLHVYHINGKDIYGSRSSLMNLASQLEPTKTALIRPADEEGGSSIAGPSRPTVTIKSPSKDSDVSDDTIPIFDDDDDDETDEEDDRQSKGKSPVIGTPKSVDSGRHSIASQDSPSRRPTDNDVIAQFQECLRQNKFKTQ
jgi:hypothetical protein